MGKRTRAHTLRIQGREAFPGDGGGGALTAVGTGTQPQAKTGQEDSHGESEAERSMGD